MSVMVEKVADAVVECPAGMQSVINDDPLITSVCEIITINNGDQVTLTFEDALTVDGDNALDDIMDSWDNSLCENVIDPGGGEYGSGVTVSNDGAPLVGDISILNFKGSVAATTSVEGVANVYINSVEVKNIDTEFLPRQTPVHAVGTDPNGILEIIAAKAAYPARMPAMGILEQDLAVNAEGLAIIGGEFKEVHTQTFSEGDQIYVGAEGNGTNIKPQGATVAIQKIGQILKADNVGATGSALIFGAGRSNDVPNIEEKHAWVGDANEVPQPTVIYSKAEVDDLITNISGNGYGIYAYARTKSNGTLLEGNNLTVVRTSTGRYTYTLTQPYGNDDYVILGNPICSTTDMNIHVHSVTPNGFSIILGKGDNGTAADIPTDIEHGITVVGVSGPTGISSAYNSWINTGNTGSEADFIASLVGPQGTQGIVGLTGAQGPQGTQGPKGDIGDTGPTGIQGDTGNIGPTGSQGLVGNTGPQGSQGIQGDTGPQGIQGATGDTGDVGSQGIQGNIGQQGVQGIAGQAFEIDTIFNSVAELLAGTITNGKFAIVAGTLPDTDPDYGKLYLYDGTWTYLTDMSVEGASGIQGPQGPQGDIGLTGAQGDIGLTGAQGPQGIQGDLGPQGSQGITGDNGAQGIQGIKGDTGSEGPDGPIGPQGDTGAQGIQGDIGLTGSQGSQGIQGDIGGQGIQGVQGIEGNVGPIGPTGPTGIQGDTGEQGLQGNFGPQGSQGIQGTAGQSFEIDAIYNSVAELLAGTITDGKFALVAGTLADTDPDYGKLYLYSAASWTYITDMSVEGAAGIEGPAGNDGAQGPQGIQGSIGIQGIQGDEGIEGPAGSEGPQGIQGTAGDTGEQGLQGIQGDLGPAGSQGDAGPQGSQGPTGSQGPQGVQGPEGPSGVGGGMFTVIFNREGSAKDCWLSHEGDCSNISNQTPAIIPWNCTISAITYTNKYKDSDADISIEVAPYGDGSTNTEKHRLELRDTRSASITNFATPVNFNAGDKVGVYLYDKGKDPKNVVVTLYLTITNTTNTDYTENYHGDFY